MGVDEHAQPASVVYEHHHLAHEGGWHLTIDPTNRTLTITLPNGTAMTNGPPHARSAREHAPSVADRNAQFRDHVGQEASASADFGTD